MSYWSPATRGNVLCSLYTKENCWYDGLRRKPTEKKNAKVSKHKLHLDKKKNHDNNWSEGKHARGRLHVAAMQCGAAQASKRKNNRMNFKSCIMQTRATIFYLNTCTAPGSWISTQGVVRSILKRHRRLYSSSTLTEKKITGETLLTCGEQFYCYKSTL